jgi:probable rRNA maturation factor
MPGIRFNYQDTDFKLPHPRLTSQWLSLVARKEKASFVCLDYIFCSDKYLLKINQDYLQHDDLTDVITFNYGEPGKKNQIEGEVYLSVERIQENATIFKVDFDSELHRVLVHGALHLFGYKDKSPADQRTMRSKEAAYLSLR